MPETISKQSFPDTPAGWAARWAVEIAAARKEATLWGEKAEKIIKRYLDERESDDKESKLGLFHADVDMMAALLLSKTPQVDVSRRFADSNDDVARVASEMLERMLNTDIEKGSDNAEEAHKEAQQDHAPAGLGNNLFFYDTANTEKVAEVPA